MVIPLQYPGITPRPGTTKDTVSNTGVVKRNDKIYFNVWAKMYVCNNVCDVCIMVASEVPNLCFLMFNSLLEIFWNLELVFPKPTLICTKGQKPSVPRQFLHRLINGSIPLSKRPISFSILCRTPWSCIPNVPRSFPETHWVSMFECVFHSLDRLWQHGKGTHRCTHRVKKRNKEEG